MAIQVIRNGLFVASLFVAMPLAADPVAAPSSDAPVEESGGETLAREAQIVIDAVLENHIDPPTRQEMWLAGARAVLAKAGVIHRPGLSAELSRLTAPEDFAGFARRLWLNDDVRKHHKSPKGLREAFFEGVLQALPGGGALISQKELKVQEQFQGNRYVGTGIVLTFDTEKKFPKIAGLFPGGPMERAGGRQGDLILRIGDRNAHGLDVNDTVDLLRGDEGTTVALEVGDVGSPRAISVTRGHVVLATVEGLHKAHDHRSFRINSDSPIRYVKLVQINGSTVHDLKKLEIEFRRDGAQAVMLDLRELRGDDLHHVVLLADALLDGGLIGRVRSQGDVQEFRADRERLFRDWPVVLLVDRQTGGAGEWIAAAVQDNRAGIVVGEESAGVWQVHSTVTLSGMDFALTLNTGIFERPDRRRWPAGYVRHSRAGAGADAPRPGVNGQITPDHCITPGDRGPVTGALPIQGPPGAAPDGPRAKDPILELAVKVLKARLNVGQSDGD
jgi:C-terminal peptidase prc